MHVKLSRFSKENFKNKFPNAITLGYESFQLNSNFGKNVK